MTDGRSRKRVSRGRAKKARNLLLELVGLLLGSVRGIGSGVRSLVLEILSLVLDISRSGLLNLLLAGSDVTAKVRGGDVSLREAIDLKEISAHDSAV